MSWQEAPLVAVDLETTGTDPLNDRIVTACVALIVRASADVQTWVLDPEIEVPAGAAKVHGYTTERVRAEGRPYATGYAQIRSALIAAWEAGYTVVAYNAAFDLTMLNAEGVRLGYEPLEPGLVLDPMLLDRVVSPGRPGRHTLAGACEFYRVELGVAHTADADALAAARLAWKMSRYPEVALLDEDALMGVQRRHYRQRQEQYMARALAEGRQPRLSGEWPVQRDSDVLVEVA